MTPGTAPRCLSVCCLWIPALVVFAAWSGGSPSSGLQNPPPSIVVLFSDDAGYADFGFQPNAAPDMKGLTPHIDSIAVDGARFSSAYVSGAVCSPSRAGLMTGRYQQRFGHETNIPPGYMKGGLPLEETFFAARLQKLGYRTGLVGKWHLGYPAGYQPNQRGHDWFYGLLQGSRSYLPLAKPSPHMVFLENTTPTAEGGYTTDRIGDAAVRFVGENAGRPFYLFVSFTAPHGPLQPKAEVVQALAAIENTRRRNYAGLVKSLDDNVGKILKAIADSGLEKNTVVLFTNDNGGQTSTGADNSPLRGRKGEVWEGGIRVPMAIRWPGRIAPGSVIDDPVSTLDFAPTAIGLAGGQTDPAWKLDGLDLADRLQNRVDSLSGRDLFWRTQGSGGPVAMRSGRWKLVHLRNQPDSSPQLFDLEADIGEASDLASTHPQVLDSMLERLKIWESGLVEPRWGNAAGQAEKEDSRN